MVTITDLFKNSYVSPDEIIKINRKIVEELEEEKISLTLLIKYALIYIPGGQFKSILFKSANNLYFDNNMRNLYEIINSLCFRLLNLRAIFDCLIEKKFQDLILLYKIKKIQRNISNSISRDIYSIKKIADYLYGEEKEKYLNCVSKYCKMKWIQIEEDEIHEFIDDFLIVYVWNLHKYEQSYNHTDYSLSIDI